MKRLWSKLPVAKGRARLWLIRHGETEWSAGDRHTGGTDVPLTDEGERQAAALGHRLRGRPFAVVLSSPLARAYETCRIAGYGDVAAFADGLREWDYGEYEGRTSRDIRAGVPGWTIWNGSPPGGETIEQVAQRASQVIERAAAAEGDAALFAHGHLLRVLAACWLGLPPDAGRLLALDTASVSILGYEHETRVIVAWNQTAALPPDNDKG